MTYHYGRFLERVGPDTEKWVRALEQKIAQKEQAQRLLDDATAELAELESDFTAEIAGRWTAPEIAAAQATAATRNQEQKRLPAPPTP